VQICLCIISSWNKFPNVQFSNPLDTVTKWILFWKPSYRRCRGFKNMIRRNYLNRNFHFASKKKHILYSISIPSVSRPGMRDFDPDSGSWSRFRTLVTVTCKYLCKSEHWVSKSPIWKVFRINFIIFLKMFFRLTIAHFCTSSFANCKTSFNICNIPFCTKQDNVD
jgi:hypothetical protein